MVGVCGAVSAAGGLCHLGLAEPTVWPDERQCIAILVLGIGPTGLAFLAWDYATKHGRLPMLGAFARYHSGGYRRTDLIFGSGQPAGTGPK